jgi:hypothetical protein
MMMFGVGRVAGWSEGRALVLAPSGEGNDELHVFGGRGAAPARARDEGGKFVIDRARAFTALASGHVLLAGIGDGGKSVKVEVWLPASLPKSTVVTLKAAHPMGNIERHSLPSWSFSGTTPETLVLVAAGNLYRFDGATFQSVEPPAVSDGWVRSAAVDDRGTLWIVTGTTPQVAYSERAWGWSEPSVNFAPPGVGRLFRRTAGAAWEDVALPDLERVAGSFEEPQLWGPRAVLTTGSGAVWVISGGLLFGLGGPDSPVRKEPVRPAPKVGPPWDGCPSLYALFYHAFRSSPPASGEPARIREELFLGLKKLTKEHQTPLVTGTLGETSWLAARAASKAKGLELVAASLPAVGVQASLVCAEPKSVIAVD